MAFEVTYGFTYDLGSDGDLPNSVKFEEFEASNVTFTATDANQTDPFFGIIEGDDTNLFSDGADGGNASDESFKTLADGKIWFTEQADPSDSTLQSATTSVPVNKFSTYDYVGQLRSFADVYVLVNDSTGAISEYYYDVPELGTQDGGENDKDKNNQVTEIINGAFDVTDKRTVVDVDTAKLGAPPTPGDTFTSGSNNFTWHQILWYDEYIGDVWNEDGGSSKLSATILATDIDWEAQLKSRTNVNTDLEDFNSVSLGYIQVGESQCFLAGTEIATPGGAVSIENLKVGDKILTAAGEQTVRFIAIRTESIASDDSSVLPIRISAHALGHGIPSADLYVSPGHSIFIEGTLVHASALVNGNTIQPVSPDHFAGASTFKYYNIELDQHHLITANGCVAESYFDIVPRKDWDNFKAYMALYGADEPLQELPYPVVSHARQLPANIRLRLQLLEQQAVAA